MRALLKSLKDRFHRTSSASSKNAYRQKPSRHRGLRLEPLEERQLLSVTVTTELDVVDSQDAYTSLREAVEEASSGDVINFNLGSSSQTIVLDASLGELEIDTSISIEGPGADLLTISGGGGSRIFNIATGTDVTISDLTLTGGSTTGSGGAIYSSALSLTIDDCVIEDSAADGHGGAIYSDTSGGTLTITDSTISGNTAGSNAGGVYFKNGTLNIDGATFEENTASYDSGAGGALALYDSTVSISNSLFYDNSARTGGAITARNGLTATLTNVTFSDNEGTISAGAVYHYSTDGGTFHYINCTITGNSARDYGGGIYHNSNGAIPATVLLDNTIMAENSGQYGPDIYGVLDSSSSYNLIGDGTSLTGITNGTSGNQIGTPSDPIDPLLGELGDYGGVTDTYDLLPGSPAIDSGDDSLNTQSYDGRGDGYDRVMGDAIDIGALEVNVIVVDESTATLASAVTTANSLAGHDIIAFDDSLTSIAITSELTVTSVVTVQGPGASGLTIDADDSSRIFNFGSGVTASISGLTLTDGSTAYSGGAIRSNASSLTITDCQILNCEADYYGGAIVNVAAGGVITINNSVIEENTATSVGGAIYSETSGSTLTITDSTISGNSAGGNAGGVYFANGTLNIDGTTFEENTASFDSGVGGALALYDSTVDISNSLFYGNSARTGGAIASRNGVGATLTNVTLSGNIADINAGAVYHYSTSGGTFHYINCTIAQNVAGSSGGGILHNSSGAIPATVRLDNTIVADNSGQYGPDIYGVLDSNSSYNLIGDSSGWSGGTNNLVDVDPLLGELADNGGVTLTHMPNADSDAIDAGSNSLCNAAYDGRGEGYLRLLDHDPADTSNPVPVIDIGAVEYNEVFMSFSDSASDGELDAGDLGDAIQGAYGLSPTAGAFNVFVTIDDSDLVFTVPDLAGDFTGDVTITADLNDDTETAYDTVTITGTAGADTFTAEPGSAVFEASSGYTVTVSCVRSIIADGGNDAGDTAIVSGSADNDTATLYPPSTTSSITGPIDRYDYSISYTGFKDATVNGNGQAQVRNSSGAVTACDLVALHGSASSEAFVLYTTSGTVEGTDYSIAYLNIPSATVTGEGGDDEAMLYGSSLGDRFVSKPATGDDFVTLTSLSGSKDYFIELDGLGTFATVTADLGAGDDEAELHEVEANLVFEAWTGGASQTLYDGSSSSVLGNETYEVAVTDAEYVLGRGHTNTTYQNTAVIYGVADDDLFVGTALFYDDATKLRAMLYAEPDTVDGDRTLTVNAYRFADVDLEVDAADSSRLWALIDYNVSSEYANLPISSGNQEISSAFWDASGTALYTTGSFTDTDTYSHATTTVPDPETVSSPTTLTLDQSESPTATLSAGETDYFSFTPTTAGHYTFQLSGLDADADLKLLASSGYVLASSLNVGTTAEAIYRTLAASTTYYVSVTAYDATVTDYDLVVTASATADQDLETIALVSNGDRLAEIVLPADADAELLAAAEDLRYYVQKLSHSNLQIVETVSDSTLKGVYLGGTAGTSDNTDSYHVTVDTNGNLSLTNAYGYTRPVAYAVSELLEDLDVAWLAPTAAWDHVSGGKAGELSVTVSTGNHEPDTSPRRWGEVGWEESQAWRRRLRANISRAEGVELTDYYALGNGVQDLFYELNKLDNDDWTSDPNVNYNLVLAQCYPDNIDLTLLEEDLTADGNPLAGSTWYPVTHVLDDSGIVVINQMAVDAIVAYLVGHNFMLAAGYDTSYDGAADVKALFDAYYSDGQGGYDYSSAYFNQVGADTTYSLGIDDIPNFDDYIWLETDGDTFVTNRYYTFVNAVADGVGDISTDYRIGAMAYAKAIEAPTTVELHENVYVYLTQNTASWWNAAAKEEDQERTDAWTDEDLWEGSVNLLRYDYFTLVATTPYFYPSLMADSLQYDANAELLGVIYEASSYYPFQAPMEWVMTQLEWDNPDEGESYAEAMADLFDEYFEMAYGEDVADLMGGDVMDGVDGSESFFGILEDAWLYQDSDWLDGDYETYSDWLKNNLVAQAESMTLDEANAALAVLDEATLTELASASPDPLVLERISELRAAMEYSKYLFEEYELVKELRAAEITSSSTEEELEAVLEKIEQVGRAANRRETAWPAAEGRDDLLGQTLSHYREREFLTQEAIGGLEGEAFVAAVRLLGQYESGTTEYIAVASRLQDASLGTIADMVTAWISTGGTNLVANGDFASSSGWTVWNSDTTDSTVTYPTTGHSDDSTGAVQISDVGAGEKTVLQQTIVDPGTVGIDAGDQFLAIAWVKVEPTTGTTADPTMTSQASLQARFKDDGEWDSLRVTAYGPEEDGWQMIAIQITIPSYFNDADDDLILQLQVEGTDGSENFNFYFDDVELRKISD